MLISDNIKKEIINHYRIDNLDNIVLLWNNENLVFSNNDIVIRMTKKLHRKYHELDTETQILSMLYKEWADVVQVIESKKGNYFESIEGEDIFITVFKKAEWWIIDIGTRKDRNKIIIEWWKSMWKIHKILANNSCWIDYNNRLNWDEEIIIKSADKLLPNSDNEILTILQNTINKVNKLKVDKVNYGIVHTDMRPRNFHYIKNKLIHFDFDDISNNWYIYDIAVAVFHETELYKSKEDRTNFMLNFLKYFIEGYKSEKIISQECIILLLEFIKIRLIYAYIDYYKRLKIKSIDSWKEKMLQRNSYILDFDSFINIKKVQKYIISLK